MSDLEDLIDTGDLDPDEEARLRRVHELLVQAGPPPELSPTLERPVSSPREGELIAFPLPLRRRVGAVAVLAAALAAVVFGGGYLIGHSKAKATAFATARVVPMHGIANSRGAIRIAAVDSAGNWPMRVSISGLPKQKAAGAYYELWLSRNGKPVAPCGGFRVKGGTTTIQLSVPYKLHAFDGWVVTSVQAADHEPGVVVMQT
jgi:hypothetical protein